MAYQPKSYRKYLAGAAAAAVVVSAVPAAGFAANVELTDISGHWGEDSITYLVDKGAIDGYGDGTYKPDNQITRAEAATVLAKSLGLTIDKSKKTDFPDAANHWASAAIAAIQAQAPGVIDGDNGKFRPQDPITRQEMAKMIVEAYDIELNEKADKTFTDNNSWGAEYVTILASQGVVDGYGSEFKPEGNVTRAETARFIHRAEDETMRVDVDKKPEVSIESVEVISKTKVSVVFSAPVDSVNAENFTIEGATVISATLAEDKKTVELEVSGLEHDKSYTVQVSNVLAGGVEVPASSKTFKTIAVADKWNLEVSAANNTLIANGADNTVLTFNLIDKTTGEVDANADNVVVELTTTHGTLAKQRATIQNGVATVLLTSEFSNKEIKAKVNAQIIEASDDYKDLIGKVSASTTVEFKASDVNPVETVSLVAAESNQADRVTLFFDKAVLVTSISDVTVTQNGEEKAVRGYKAVKGNEKAVEAILEKDSVLTDNKEVQVKAVTINSLGKVTNSDVKFNVTDARTPEVTSVQAEGLNKLKVVFSEAIDTATFKIDGKFVQGKDFDVKFGEFNPVTGEDRRNEATITLNSDFDEDPSDDKNKLGYFLPGSHSLQVSSLKDFAARTDDANIGTTQTLAFNVAEDTTKPSVDVTVESPEQFRLSFDKKLVESEEAILEALELQVFDEDSKAQDKWVAVDGDYFKNATADVDFDELLSIQRVSDTNEYVVELTADWTRIYDTSATKENYYNDQFRIKIAEDKLTAEANGEKNGEQLLDLSKEGSLLTEPDTKSAKITNIDIVNFVVTMDEPVKLAGGKDNAGDTLNQTQSSLPNTSVQFIGKDKDGKTVTFEGTVIGYASKDGSDTQFRVAWTPVNNTTPQTVVNDGGSGDWKLVVKSLSDDVGNTVATETASFKLKKQDAAEDLFLIENVTGYTNGTDEDQVVITFTDGVQYKGGVNDATDPSQYTLNGENLPKGTSITVADDLSKVTDKNKEFEKVIITLPDNYLKNSVSNIITVNKNLVSEDGSVLIGEYEKVFQLLDEDYEEGTAPVDPVGTPAFTFKVDSTLPGFGKGTALVTLTDVADPENYTVTVGDVELEYSAEFKDFTGVVPSSATEADVKVEKKVETPVVAPEFTFKVDSTLPGFGKGTALVTLTDVADPENYTVTVGDVELEYSAEFKDFTGVVPSSATEADVVVAKN